MAEGVCGSVCKCVCVVGQQSGDMGWGWQDRVVEDESTPTERY